MSDEKDYEIVDETELNNEMFKANSHDHSENPYDKKNKIPRRQGKRPKNLTKKRKNIIKEMHGKGFRIVDITKALRISKDTYYRWLKEHPDFHDEIEEVKYKIDMPVVNALRRNATGFMYEEKRYKIVREEDPDTGQTVEKRILVAVNEKHVLPETNAIMQWLTNRHPKEWKKQQNLDITSGGKSLLPKVDYKDMTEDEAKEEYNKMLSDMSNKDNIKK